MLRVRLFLSVVVVALSSVTVFAKPTFCPDTPALRFWSGAAGRVVNVVSSRLRAEPSLEGEILKEMASGTVFTVLADSTCADDLRWWPIEVEGQTGWAAEGPDAIGYYMEPLTSEPPVIDNSALIDVWTYGFETDPTWAPDRSTLAVASQKGIWIYAGDDLEAQPRLLANQSYSVSAIAFDPNDSNALYAGDEGGSISRWDVAVGRVEHIGRLDASVKDLFFSETGQALAVVLSNHDVYVLTPEDYSLPLKITPDQTVNSISTRAVFSHDETMIAVATNTGSVQVYDLHGQLLKTFALEGDVTYAVAFSLDDTLLAASDEDLTVWNIASQMPVIDNARAKEDGSIDDIFFLPDNQLLTRTDIGLGTTYSLWNTETWQPTKELQKALGGTPFIASDGRSMIYNTEIPQAMQYALVEEVDFEAFETPTVLVKAISFSDLAITPDGSRLIRDGLDGLDVIDTDTGRVLATLPLGPSGRGSYLISPDGHYFATCVNSSLFIYQPSIVVYDLTTLDDSQEPLNTFYGDSDTGFTVGCTFLTFLSTPDGERLAFDAYPTTLVLWDFVAGEDTRIPPVGAESAFYASQIQGTTFVTGRTYKDSGVDSTFLYDLTQPQDAPVRVPTEWGTGKNVRISVNGLAVPVGYDGRDIAFYDLTTQAETARIPTPSSITAIAVNNDVTWLATAHADHIIRLWDLDAPETPVILGQVSVVPDELIFDWRNQRLYGAGYVWDLSSIIGGPNIDG